MIYLLAYCNPLTLFLLFLLAFKAPKSFCYVGRVVGWPCDVLFNLTWASLLFLQVPDTLTFTERLEENKKDGGWRGKLANWICTNLLNRFVFGHCKG